MDPHQYLPLSDPRCTRLIRLQPGKTKDPSCPLRCDLVEIDLDNAPEYLALSYTWNGETPSEPLTIGNAQVHNSQAGQQLLITPNCAAALRAFRQSLHRRFNRRKCLQIWVDAICINQASNDDKSTQVAMMAEIFQHAKRVVVWLGERDSPSTPSTMICSLPCALLPDVDMGRLSDFVYWTTYKKGFRWLRPLVKRLEKLTADAILIICCDIGTIQAMLNNSYWTRVWTVQEFANTHVSFLCQDSNLISCAGMMKMIFLSQHTMARYISHHRLYNERRAFGHNSPDIMHVPNALQDVLELQALDPRDKIFAFRAFSARCLAKVAVDYRRPVQDLFTEASRTVIKDEDGIYLLYFASLEKTSPGTGTGLMPSWSLDFGTKDLHEYYHGAHMDHLKSANASRGAHPWISFPNAGLSLRVRGRHVGVIGDLTGHIDPIGNSFLMAKTDMGHESRQESDESDTRSVSSSADNPKDYQYRLEKLMRHFVSILHRKVGTDPVSEAKMAATLFELLRSIVELANRQPIPMPFLKSNATLHDVLEVLCNNDKIGFEVKWAMGEGRMFFTIDGRAGLGVPRISEGDEILLIAGLQHPFVLRPHGDSGEYTLVGPAVVTGMMKGELWPEDETELRDIDIV